MIWNHECRKTRRLLALWIGNDLEERDAAGIERHLAVCPQCREIRQGLGRSHRALDAARPQAIAEGQSSVWPGVSRHIRSIDELSSASGWRDWLPTGALAAACIAVIAVLVPSGRSLDSGLALTSDPVRVMVGRGAVQPVSFGNRPRISPPADPDSYRNF